MWKSTVLKASLFVVMMALCVGVPIVNAEGVALDWTSPTTADLNSVFMLNASDGWAVGDSGTTIHWNGADWSNVTSHTTEDLYSVFMVSSNDVWAVGTNGLIIHWDGTDWSFVASHTTNTLYSVQMLNASYGWAVGYGGVSVRWNGVSWSIVTTPLDSNDSLYSVCMVSASDGWAVGENYTSIPQPFPQPPIVDKSGMILRWGGTQWSVYDTGLNMWRRIPKSVFMLNANNGWAVGYTYLLIPGDNVMLHWNGVNWTEVATPTTAFLYSVYMVSSNDVWAVGSGGTIIHWDGTSWSNATSPTTNNLNSVYMVSAEDGWAVGASGTIIRWTGTEWIPEFPTAILMPFLISLTLIAAILAKTASKKRRSPSISSKTQL